LFYTPNFVLAIVVPAGTSFLTPVGNIPKVQRSTAKQDSFKKKLLIRSRSIKKENKCWICGVTYDRLQAAHIFAVESKERQALSDYYLKFPFDLPASVNDSANGLLLCALCHENFDSKKRDIKISRDGKIVLSKSLQKHPIYVSLRGKKVWWKKFIGKNQFPSGKLLQLHFELEKRPQNLYLSDISESGDIEDEDSDEEQPTIRQTRTQTTKHVRFQ
jgi:hypothetical protein